VVLFSWKLKTESVEYIRDKAKWMLSDLDVAARVFAALKNKKIADFTLVPGFFINMHGVINVLEYQYANG
jgi:hypothetical protein